MSATPDHLSALRTQALASITGTSLADEYERGAIDAAWTKRARMARTTDELLRVDLRGGDLVGAHVIAHVTDSMQNATARLVRAAVAPEVDPARRIGKADRRKAEIVQSAQIGNVLFFQVPSRPETGMDIPAWSETQTALRTLVDYLPQSESDDAAVDGILGGEKALRLAVKDVSEAARVAPQGLSIQLEAGTDVVNSILTKDRAEALIEELGKKEEQTFRAKLYGTLDGLRGSRHVVYLIGPDGKDFAVSAGDEQLWAVRQHITKRVTLDVLVTERESAAGRKRVSYTLRSVTPDPELF